jgi:hypothetical protein
MQGAFYQFKSITVNENLMQTLMLSIRFLFYLNKPKVFTQKNKITKDRKNFENCKLDSNTFRSLY